MVDDNTKDQSDNVVPEDLQNMGNDTNIPEGDSPQTLDEAVSEGDDINPRDEPGEVIKPKDVL